VLYDVLFSYLFTIECFQSLSFGVNDFENLQELNVQDFEQQLVGEQSKWTLTILILCDFFSLFHILAYML
jgi:phenylalanine-4-hydroxylase